MSIVPCRRQGNLQDQQTTNKENIPPTIVAQVKKLARVNKVLSLTQQGRWTSNALEAAMDVVERQLSLRKASKFWHIFVTSLSYYLNGRIRSNKLGPQGVFTN